MLPKTHAILGAIFSGVFYLIFPSTEIYNIILIFLASFLIDFDHYVVSINENRKNLNLVRSFRHHLEKGKVQAEERRKGIRRKGSFHLFHTIEFHILILLLGVFVFKPFLYIFIGMAFHSLCDVYYLVKLDYLYRREFFMTKWIIDK